MAYYYLFVMKKCIILANGRAPLKSIITYLQSIGYNTLICADGGANSARKMNIIPDFIVGDLDSIASDTLKFFSSKSVIKKVSRQNDTDIEKCIKFALSKKFSDIILLGVTGDRLDHSFCNMGIVLKFFKDVKLKIIAEESILVPYTGNVELKSVKQETISLYGFDRETKISSHGLYYPLKNISLPFGEKESTSNVAVGERIKLKITGGIIFIIRDFKTLKSHGLLQYI